MSCDAVAFSAFLWLASASPASAQAAIPVAAVAPQSVASQPLFADIVRRAGALKAQSEAYKRDDLAAGVDSLPGFAAFRASVAELAALDMQGHVVLEKSGGDGDLKCILKGISQDLPVRLKDLESAPTAKARLQAINEMTYLLRDNVEVITAPPRPAA